MLVENVESVPELSEYPRRGILDEDLANVLGYLASGVGEEEAAVALDRIVVDFNAVINKQSAKFRNCRIVDRDDSRQEGVFGVFDALERAKLDVSAAEFVAYSKYRIFDAMFKQVAQIDGTVSLSDGTFKRVIETRKILIELGDGDITLEEILEREGMTERRFSSLFGLNRLFSALPFEDEVSIDDHVYPISEEYGDDDIFSNDPADLVDDAVARADISELVDRMPERLQTIVRHTYGLHGYEMLNLKQIGVLLGVTESRICQILGQAKKLLKLHLEFRGYS